MQEQGQGDGTEFKQRGLAAAFYINLAIFQAKLAHHPRACYCHFDLNSGAGMNAAAGCIGSPLAFLQAATAADCEKYRAWFIDIEPATAAALAARPEMQDRRLRVLQADNQVFIRTIPDLIRGAGENPRMAVGSVLSDPNGWAVPLEELAWLGKECPRLDLVIHWNATIVKRCMTVFGRGTRLCEALAPLGKSHWLIREPFGPWQFTLLVGRGIETREHRALRLYRLESPKGQEILRRCSYTTAERAALDEANPPQLRLF